MRTNKGILETAAEEHKKRQVLTDDKIIQGAISQVNSLKDAQNIQAKLRGAPVGTVKIYDLTLSLDGQPKQYVAIVYPTLVFDVVKFLVQAAQNNNFVGFTIITPNCTIVKNYKG